VRFTHGQTTLLFYMNKLLKFQRQRWRFSGLLPWPPPGFGGTPGLAADDEFSVLTVEARVELPVEAAAVVLEGVSNLFLSCETLPPTDSESVLLLSILTLLLTPPVGTSSSLHILLSLAPFFKMPAVCSLIRLICGGGGRMGTTRFVDKSVADRTTPVTRRFMMAF
jgi:hypothetical protein